MDEFLFVTIGVGMLLLLMMMDPIETLRGRRQRLGFAALVGLTAAKLFKLWMEVR